MQRDILWIWEKRNREATKKALRKRVIRAHAYLHMYILGQSMLYEHCVDLFTPPWRRLRRWYPWTNTLTHPNTIICRISIFIYAAHASFICMYVQTFVCMYITENRKFGVALQYWYAFVCGSRKKKQQSRGCNKQNNAKGNDTHTHTKARIERASVRERAKDNNHNK